MSADYYVTDRDIDNAQKMVSKFPVKSRPIGRKNIRPGGMTTGEIGLVLGIPKRTVDGILQRGIRKLRIYREVLEDFKLE